jgi:chemotaxis protein MotA
MDPGTLIGIVVGFAAIFIGMTMEGASLGSLVEPSSAVIVILGTVGATMGGFLLKDTTGLVGVIKNALLGKVHQSDDAIRVVVQMAEQARR